MPKHNKRSEVLAHTRIYNLMTKVLAHTESVLRFYDQGAGAHTVRSRCNSTLYERLVSKTRITEVRAHTGWDLRCGRTLRQTPKCESTDGSTISRISALGAQVLTHTITT